MKNKKTFRPMSPKETTDMLSRKCPKCGRIRESKEDIENIDEFGECLLCEKLRQEAREL